MRKIASWAQNRESYEVESWVYRYIHVQQHYKICPTFYFKVAFVFSFSSSMQMLYMTDINNVKQFLKIEFTKLFALGNNSTFCFQLHFCFWNSETISFVINIFYFQLMQEILSLMLWQYPKLTEMSRKYSSQSETPMDSGFAPSGFFWRLFCSFAIIALMLLLLIRIIQGITQIHKNIIHVPWRCSHALLFNISPQHSGHGDAFSKWVTVQMHC